MTPNNLESFPTPSKGWGWILVGLVLAFMAVSLTASAQEDSNWIKVRSIAYNGAEDLWVRKGSDADSAYRKGLPRIHDTVYINTLRAKVLALRASLDSILNPKPYATSGQIFYASGSSTMSWISLSNPAKKKKRKRPKTSGRWVLATAVECPMDTVYGEIVYNSKRPDYVDGNTRDSGYWVGCGHKNIVLHDGYFMMPGKYFRTDEYMDGHTEFKIVDNGKFYDMDDNHIGNYRVYGLIYTPKKDTQ